MKKFLLKFFTWWNGQTFGTQFHTWRVGKRVGEDEAADPTVVGVDQELADPSPGVVADERDVGQVERGEEVVDDHRDAARAQIGGGLHRD